MTEWFLAHPWMTFFLALLAIDGFFRLASLIVSKFGKR